MPPSTYTSLNIHFIFSTKHREPTIAAGWRQRLHEYLNGTALAMGCVPIAAGGIADHVHMLLNLRPTQAPSDLIREIKKASSLMIHREIGLRAFAWQEGYAAIAVSPNTIGSVQRYIAKQEQHHRSKSFEEEMEQILRSAGLATTDFPLV